MSLVYLKTESIILIRADKKKTNRNDLLPGGGVAQPMFRWRVKRGWGFRRDTQTLILFTKISLGNINSYPLHDF